MSGTGPIENPKTGSPWVQITGVAFAIMTHALLLDPATDLDTDLTRRIARDGFALDRAPATRRLLDRAGLADWAGFAATWGDLGLDGYMADGGRYRRRRHAAFAVTADAITRKPHQPHYQSRDYNSLNGGIARWFDPVTDAAAGHPAMSAVVQTCRSVFGQLAPGVAAWHVEIHQFRIEALAGQAGRPTPEGMHRDGVDYVLVLMVRRENVARGVTAIRDLDRNELGSFTLTDGLDAAWVDDNRVFHGVTPVVPVDPARSAWRDVLVVTFRREGGA